jgi:hypothetical protein
MEPTLKVIVCLMGGGKNHIPRVETKKHRLLIAYCMRMYL